MAPGERQALEAAWKREKRGEERYRERAASMGNPAAKITFQTLAKRQSRYLTIIQRVRTAPRTCESSRCKESRFPAFPPVSRVVESILRKVARSRHPQVNSIDRTDFQAFLRAFGFEERGATIYTREKNRFGERCAGRLFEFLRGRKAEHYRILDDVLACSHPSKRSSMTFIHSRVTKKEKNS
jgi:hypothetical protein